MLVDRCANVTLTSVADICSDVFDEMKSVFERTNCYNLRIVNSFSTGNFTAGYLGVNNV